MNARSTASETAASLGEGTVAAVLAALCFSHFLNDMLQGLLPAIFPLLKSSFSLSFAEIGLIATVLQLTASLLQPVVGFVTDRRQRPYLLACGSGFSLVGLLLIATAQSFWMLLVAAAVLGMGSSIFHPEASRVARLASGGRTGLAQSVFQVGGNAGQAMGPLLAALIIMPGGRSRVAWFGILAICGMVVLWNVGRWYARRRNAVPPRARHGRAEGAPALSRRTVGISLAILCALIFSKYFYLAGLTTYYTFFLIEKFHLSVQAAQIDLFIFMGAVAAGTLVGGPLGDRIGRKYVIWGSILGVLPFTLALPYAGLALTTGLSVVIGLVISSAFSAILVYAQELVPGKVGTVSGLFFGFAFGVGGIGAAVLGAVADATSLEFVYRICSFLPAIGLLTAFLPNLDGIFVKTRTPPGAQPQPAGAAE